jgi:hypothetical protein
MIQSIHRPVIRAVIRGTATGENATPPVGEGMLASDGSTMIASDGSTMIP